MSTEKRLPRVPERVTLMSDEIEFLINLMTDAPKVFMETGRVFSKESLTQTMPNIKTKLLANRPR